MRYAMLIYTDGAEDAKMSPEEQGAEFQGYMTFNQEAKAGGTYLAGEALQPIATATTVRVQGGEIGTTDGPFAETKEQFGGFYLLECKDLDEAIAYAAKIPAAKHGSVEVRPIMEMPGD
jgi:hypothetical protein